MVRNNQKKANSGEQLRQILKERVRHPYITNQGLEPPLPGGGIHEAETEATKDAESAGDRADPCA